MDITARNARAEARAITGADYEPVVLEPSPPAVTDGPFLADDPVTPPAAATAAVVPAGLPGEADWNRWLDADPANGVHADWVAANWLGGRRRLPTPPADLSATRTDLHRLAAYVVAPTRHRANGKFGLRWTRNGFGTPFFPGPDGADRQVRVEATGDGATLVDQVGDSVATAPVTTLAAAAALLGTEVDQETAAEHDSPPAGDLDGALEVDPDSAHFLGQWFGMAFAALEVVRADPGSVDPSRPQLWPGHFDPAIEVGDEDHRGSYGASPGDHSIDEPYLYLSVWWPDRLDLDQADPAWNAPSFTGSILKLSDFPADTDPVEVAAQFWLGGRDRL